MNNHEWVSLKKFRPLLTCKRCGMVKAVGYKDNGLCSGKTRPELRENRVVK